MISLGTVCLIADSRPRRATGTRIDISEKLICVSKLPPKRAKEALSESREGGQLQGHARYRRGRPGCPVCLPHLDPLQGSHIRIRSCREERVWARVPLPPGAHRGFPHEDLGSRSPFPSRFNCVISNDCVIKCKYASMQFERRTVRVLGCETTDDFHPRPCLH